MRDYPKQAVSAVILVANEKSRSPRKEVVVGCVPSHAWSPIMRDSALMAALEYREPLNCPISIVIELWFPMV